MASKAEKLRLNASNAKDVASKYDSTVRLLNSGNEIVQVKKTAFSEPIPTENKSHNLQDIPDLHKLQSDSLSIPKMAPYFAKVPYEKIDANPFNARQVYHPEKVHQKALEIQAEGQLQPGIATIRNGRYVLAAGHYRWKGIGVAKYPTMDLMIHENLTDQDLYRISFKENSEREDQSAIDNALSWKSLLDQNLFQNQTEIAESTGISLPNVNKTLKILELPQAVVDFCREKGVQYFPLGSMYQLVLISKLTDTQTILEIAEKIYKGELSNTAIEEMRKTLEHPKQRKKKENPRQYEIVSDNQKCGYIKDFGSGKIMLQVNIADPVKRAEILNDLKSKFEVH
ncbi:ParB/RepB/Spo0J family partition protein [Undibacterium oligocarboniphilum]|uniref:ParB/RepB/Spo0J family partition protein n=1 Tax=Undibacterium oligocarboniphilum TaxID=666702 RepID=A0A850QHF8_9BURK|nr:ParB/RepB/Spo0J family partition protein [Undibacterium oligocarboniphilum]MBC3871403.1 ParB/RepB/Spo0J family partition protein [Undibacterium oligocarboniphilum]NVO79021.1 ParB/RepB/Spo0J family partition protein [Undibacterium oligocarboniphilum]